MVEASDLPDELVVTARSEEGEIMALRHREHPIVGLQFHPESILTEHGHDAAARPSWRAPSAPVRSRRSEHVGEARVVGRAA